MHGPPGPAALAAVMQANRNAQRLFTNTGQTASNGSTYQKYDLRSPPLSPAVRSAAKTTLKFSFMI
ncbi:MAG: hypothetical protein CMI30_01210 [Opitutae bacterium]|nr:hypothetical protein [Opitutae bacterium]